MHVNILYITATRQLRTDTEFGVKQGKDVGPAFYLRLYVILTYLVCLSNNNLCLKTILCIEFQKIKEQKIIKLDKNKYYTCQM